MNDVYIEYESKNIESFLRDHCEGKLSSDNYTPASVIRMEIGSGAALGEDINIGHVDAGNIDISRVDVNCSLVEDLDNKEGLNSSRPKEEIWSFHLHPLAVSFGTSPSIFQKNTLDVESEGIVDVDVDVDNILEEVDKEEVEIVDVESVRESSLVGDNSEHLVGDNSEHLTTSYISSPHSKYSKYSKSPDVQSSREGSPSDNSYNIYSRGGSQSELHPVPEHLPAPISSGGSLQSKTASASPAISASPASPASPASSYISSSSKDNIPYREHSPPLSPIQEASSSQLRLSTDLEIELPTFISANQDQTPQHNLPITDKQLTYALPQNTPFHSDKESLSQTKPQLLTHIQSAFHQLSSPDNIHHDDDDYGTQSIHLDDVRIPSNIYIYIYIYIYYI